MEKVIRISLVSSVLEQSALYQQLQEWISTVSQPLESGYDVALRLLPEGADPTEAELCFFVFGGCRDAQTLQQWEAAVALGTIRVYSFFWAQTEFSAQLDAFRGTFSAGAFDIFRHVDTLKLRLLMLLQPIAFPKDALWVKDGCCYLDGQKILQLENVEEFQNNIQFPRLRKILAAAQSQCQQQKAEFERDELMLTPYAQTVERCNWLRAEIQSLYADIFDFSGWLTEAIQQGKLTECQREACRWFRLGDYEQAACLLNPEEIGSSDADVYLQEQRMKITLLALMRMPEYYDRYIVKAYQQLLPVALETRSGWELVLQYSSWLLRQGNNALEVLESLEAVCCQVGVDRLLYGDLLRNKACAYAAERSEQAAEAYRNVIDFYKNLARIAPHFYLPQLLQSYIDACGWFLQQGDRKRAMELYEEGCQVRIPGAPSVLTLQRHARLCSDAGLLCMQQDCPEAAEAYLCSALEFWQQLAADLPNFCDEPLAEVYGNLARLYHSRQQLSQAEKFYQRALTLWEVLADQNPVRYTQQLTSLYRGVAKLCHERRSILGAEKYYRQAVELNRMLAWHNPQFRVKLAESLHDLGVFYIDAESVAEPYLEEAIEIRTQLMQEEPERFALPLAESCLAMLEYYIECDYRGGEKFGLQAAEILEAKLENGDRSVLPLLEKAYQGMTIICHGEAAVPYYEKQIRTAQALAEDDPVGALPRLADAYFRCGLFTDDDAAMQKAVMLARLQPEHPTCRVILETQGK